MIGAQPEALSGRERSDMYLAGDGLATVQFKTVLHAFVLMRDLCG